MNFDLFEGRLENNNSESDNSFLSELNNYQNDNYILILDSAKSEFKLTSSSIDSIKVRRNRVLNEYAKETEDKGEMFYIFDKNSKDEGYYNLTSCTEGKSHEVIQVKKEDLPEGSRIDSVLRNDNGKYILDVDSTKEIEMRLKDIIQEALNIQNEELNNFRVDGHEYEVVEYSSDRVWLIDNNSDSGDVLKRLIFQRNI